MLTIRRDFPCLIGISISKNRKKSEYCEIDRHNAARTKRENILIQQEYVGEVSEPVALPSTPLSRYRRNNGSAPGVQIDQRKLSVERPDFIKVSADTQPSLLLFGPHATAQFG